MTSYNHKNDSIFLFLSNPFCLEKNNIRHTTVLTWFGATILSFKWFPSLTVKCFRSPPYGSLLTSLHSSMLASSKYSTIFSQGNLNKKYYAFLSSTSCNWIKLHPISNKQLVISMYVGFCHFVIYDPKRSYDLLLYISFLEKKEHDNL